MDKNLKISIIAIAFLSAQADDLNLDKTQLDINKNHTTQHVNLDEIMVSANKMDERLKDVAQSISVLSGIEIQERRIQNIQDVIRQIPNMNFTTFVSKTLVNFRGINHSNFTNSNPVAIYFDGIATTNHYGFYNSRFNNVERNRQKAYAIANLHAGYRTDNFDVYAYVLNATNTNYTNGYMVHGGQYDMISFGEPRRVGVGVKYSF